MCDPVKKKLVTLTFLRTNAQDEHDDNVNGVDIADQCRGHHRMEKWCRNVKWWMALWHWGHGDLNLNGLKVYESANIDIWLTCTEKNRSNT